MKGLDFHKMEGLLKFYWIDFIREKHAIPDDEWVELIGWGTKLNRTLYRMEEALHEHYQKYTRNTKSQPTSTKL